MCTLAGTKLIYLSPHFKLKYLGERETHISGDYRRRCNWYIGHNLQLAVI